MRRQSLVLMVEPKSARNEGHAEALAHAGFRVLSLAPEEVDVVRALKQGPAVVAAELDDAGLVTALNLARRFRETPEARLIPFIIYGHQLGPQDIEATARRAPCGCSSGRSTVCGWSPPFAVSSRRLMQNARRTSPRENRFPQRVPGKNEPRLSVPSAETRCEAADVLDIRVLANVVYRVTAQ